MSFVSTHLKSPEVVGTVQETDFSGILQMAKKVSDLNPGGYIDVSNGAIFISLDNDEVRVGQQFFSRVITSLIGREEVIEAIMPFLPGDYDTTQGRLEVSLSSRMVSSDTSQRGGGWHVDEYTAEGFLVADELPTEFVSGKLLFGAHKRLKAVKPFELDIEGGTKYEADELINEFIEDGKLDIFRPQPLEVVQFNNKNIHRSPVNFGPTRYRNFLRISKFF